MRRQNYLYSSVFSKEMTDYIRLRRESGKYTAKTESTLKDLDAYFVKINLSNKVISHDVLSDWQKTRTVSAVTKHQDCAHVNGFCSYLNTLGIEAAIAEKPKFKSEYVPYIFNSEEMERIFFAADNTTTIYTSVTPELANKYLRERGKVFEKIDTEPLLQADHVVSALPFLNRLSKKQS